MAARCCGSPASHYLHHSVNHRVTAHDACMWPVRRSSSLYRCSFHEVAPCWYLREENKHIMPVEGTPGYSHNLSKPLKPPDKTSTYKTVLYRESVCVGVLNCRCLRGLVESLENYYCCCCMLIASEWHLIRLLLALQEVPARCINLLLIKRCSHHCVDDCRSTFIQRHLGQQENREMIFGQKDFKKSLPFGYQFFFIILHGNDYIFATNGFPQVRLRMWSTCVYRWAVVTHLGDW